jgi:hypothetical protein
LRLLDRLLLLALSILEDQLRQLDRLRQLDLLLPWDLSLLLVQLRQ